MELISPDLQSNYISIQENSLIFGAIEQVQLEEYQSYAPSEVQKAFENLVSLNMEFRYLNGECHNRAHLGALYLQAKGYDIFKVWNFSPFLFTTLSRKTLLIKDILEIQDAIKAEYHVSIGIREKSEPDEFNIMVLDPSFSQHPLSIKAWRKFQNCENAMFLFTNYKEYLFNTLNGLRIFNNKSNPTEFVQLPTWFPKIMSGDFFRYTGLSKDQSWIQKGLATSDVGYEIFKDVIENKISKSYFALIQDINLLRIRLETNKMPDKYIQTWQERILHWTQKIKEIEKDGC